MLDFLELLQPAIEGILTEKSNDGCLTSQLLGISIGCPGCGIIRGCIAMITGQPIVALKFNVATPFVLSYAFFKITPIVNNLIPTKYIEINLLLILMALAGNYSLQILDV